MKSADDNKKIGHLLARIRKNDLTALGELMELKSRDIERIAYHILRDTNLASDIVDEVMISFIKNVHLFDDAKNINSWIHTVAINASIDCYRKRKKEICTDDDVLSNFSSPSKTESEIITKLSVVAALDALDDLSRKILLDKILNGLSYSRLSAKYELSVKQIRLRYEKAKKRFIEIYDQDE